MKRIFFLLASLLLIVTSSVSAQDKTNDVIFTKGRIAEVLQSSILIEGTGAFHEIVVHIYPSTHIVKAEDGSALGFADLKKGDEVTAYYGNAVAKSMPPQANALAIVAGKAAKGPSAHYLRVASVERKDADCIKVLNANKDLLVTIERALLAKAANVRQGSELIVWYDKIAMSMPGQTAASKAKLLPQTVFVHIGAGVIAINGRELALSEGESLLDTGKTIMLPLRVVAEGLGHRVAWNEEQCRVDVTDEAGTSIMLSVCSQVYQKDGKEVKLAFAPDLFFNKTWVPVEFFEKLLDVRVVVDRGHI